MNKFSEFFRFGRFDFPKAGNILKLALVLLVSVTAMSSCTKQTMEEALEGRWFPEGSTVDYYFEFTATSYVEYAKVNKSATYTQSGGKINASESDFQMKVSKPYSIENTYTINVGGSFWGVINSIDKNQFERLTKNGDASTFIKLKEFTE